MRNKIIFATTILFAACIIFVGCDNNKAPEKTQNVASTPTMIQPAKDTALFADVKFDSKWDLSCGMPISAGLEDTVHYKGKVYGFCSKECKDDFLKDPVTAINSKH